MAQGTDYSIFGGNLDLDPEIFKGFLWLYSYAIFEVLGLVEVCTLQMSFLLDGLGIFIDDKRFVK